MLAPGRGEKTRMPGNLYWRGGLSTIDLLIKIACFVKNIFFFIRCSWSEIVSTTDLYWIWYRPVVSTRKSTVLILPVQWGFPCSFQFKNENGGGDHFFFFKTENDLSGRDGTLVSNVYVAILQRCVHTGDLFCVFVEKPQPRRQQERAFTSLTVLCLVSFILAIKK
jgi:hypothetical protein